MTGRPLDLLLSGTAEGFVLFVLLAVAIIEAIALHEYAHALSADLQGDRLPRAMGRLTLNPAPHLDPLGTLLILLAGFGWGRPVEFRPQALSSRRFGAAVVALAGPGMNLVLAITSSLLFRVAEPALPGLAQLFILNFAFINVLLGVFNLLPIPPLDGSRLLTVFLPPGRQQIIYFLDRWGFLILIGLVFFGRFLLAPVFLFAQRLVAGVAGLI